MKKYFVKVCGLTTERNIDQAVDLGYDAIGIVRYPPSPRFCDEKTAKELLAYGRGRIKTVAVSMTLDEIGPVKDDCDYIQVYEGIEGQNIIAAGNSKPVSHNFSWFLYDTSKGSGDYEGFPQWLEDYKDRLIIAGGLDPDNITGILQKIQCAGVDVSSGVEKVRGTKDYELMKRFIQEVRDAEH